MITCFLKDNAERDAKISIIKFWDRIWLDEYGTLEILREFDFKVEENSPCSIRKIKLFIPFSGIMGVKDRTSTALDQDYLFNRKQGKTLGYEINSQKRTVANDGFKDIKPGVELIEETHIGNGTLLEVRLSESINPNEMGMVRLFFSVPSQLVKTSAEVRSVDLKYFSGFMFPNEMDLLNIKSLEIPTYSILNSNKTLGGFDIFVYLPLKWEALNTVGGSSTTSKAQSDGSLGEAKRVVRWKAREIISQNPLTSNTPFTSHLLVKTPAITNILEQTQKRINTLESHSKYTIMLSVIAILIAIITAIIMFI